MDVKGAVLGDLTEVKKYLILLLSDNNNQPINGKLWYQKELFMLSKNNKKLSDETDFEPYFWGPHSELADSEMEELSQLGVVKQVGNSYVLTDIGKKIAEDISKNSPKSEKELVHDVKNFLNNLNKDELLLFVYVTFPEMSEDAVELPGLLKRRKPIALNLYKQGKVSIGKAAELSGLSVSELSKELAKKKG